MNENHYDLRFLPTFEEDLNDAVDYIRLQLCNPIAARNLVTEVEKAIYERLRFPEAFRPTNLYSSTNIRITASRSKTTWYFMW